MLGQPYSQNMLNFLAKIAPHMLINVMLMKKTCMQFMVAGQAFLQRNLRLGPYIWVYTGCPSNFCQGLNHSSQIGEKIQFNIMKGTSVENAFHQTERYCNIQTTQNMLFLHAGCFKRINLILQNLNQYLRVFFTFNLICLVI